MAFFLSLSCENLTLCPLNYVCSCMLANKSAFRLDRHIGRGKARGRPFASDTRLALLINWCRWLLSIIVLVEKREKWRRGSWLFDSHEEFDAGKQNSFNAHTTPITDCHYPSKPPVSPYHMLLDLVDLQPGAGHADRSLAESYIEDPAHLIFFFLLQRRFTTQTWMCLLGS